MSEYDKKMVRRTWFLIGFLLALAIVLWACILSGVAISVSWGAELGPDGPGPRVATLTPPMATPTATLPPPPTCERGTECYPLPRRLYLPVILRAWTR
ncbi:MAG: hypothetical protein FJW34_21450 [Acidobacteria bacterium]|nr:hypothetical protein [Acidobacteriota bacterium]